MANSYIDFACVQQKLERTDEKPVASGASVLIARFDLCHKWDGLTVWARFKHGAAVYDVPIIDGCAQIPWEVVNYTGFSVSIWGEKEGGGRLTSAKVFVDVKRSIEPEGVSPLPSTPAQVDMFIKKAAAAEAAADSAAQSAQEAAESVAIAPGIKEAAESAASNAAASATAAADSMHQAADSATAAAGSATKAAANAMTASNMANTATNKANAACDSATAAATSEANAAASATAAAKSAKEAAEAAASAGGGGTGGVSAAFDNLIIRDSGVGDFSYYSADNYNKIMIKASDGAFIESSTIDDDGDGEHETVVVTIGATGGGSGEAGEAGADGEDGATFTPSVSADGVISWTNDKGLSNPAPVNIKGAKGDTGEQGPQGETGPQGPKGDTGDTGPAGKDGAKGDTGATGQRGAGIYSVTTAPSSYTTAIGDFTPKYRIKLSTAKAQSGATEIIVGDQIRYSYYTYPIGYVDSSYAYMATRVSLRGATGEAGADGKDYSFDPTAYRLPILYLTGDTTGISKDNAVTLSYEYGENSGSCTLKWQGSSSLAWDKKNYTIKTDTAFEAVEGWGAQKKYCLKANWIDHSHSRNVVSAKLWGLVRKSGANTPANLKALPNAGAIDGFPVIVMLNGEFHGLYSFNIPKDAWQFGMGSGTKEAIVGADNQADDTAFKAETLLDADGWELEYNSDSFSAAAVKDSLNNLIRACMNTTGSDLDTTVAQHLDWESAIDYYIFAVILKGGDMITKNALLATFDGVKWYFSAYDMDTTYGLEFDGSCLTRAVSNTNFEEIAAQHRVFELIKRFKTNELKARYKELRTNALSETRICQYFENYLWDVSSPILMEDVKRWPSVRGSSVNGIDQICRWVRQRLEVADAWLDALPAQETPVEPEAPIVNLVPTSTDADGSVYNGTGYKDNARLSSSGGVSGTAQNGSVVTGFIPYAFGDVIRIKGAVWLGNTASKGGHWYLNFYNSSKSLLDNGATNEESYTKGTFNGHLTVAYDAATGVTTFSLDDTSLETGLTQVLKSASFFRINAYGKGADLIVTVNQEITA
jgi:hypothetical protein